jgi:hypothetical protein
MSYFDGNNIGKITKVRSIVADLLILFFMLAVGAGILMYRRAPPVGQHGTGTPKIDAVRSYRWPIP